MAAARFTTKQQAAEVAARFPLAGPVWISPITAAIEKLVPGWYVGFPKNVSRRFVEAEEV